MRVKASRQSAAAEIICLNVCMDGCLENNRQNN